jgi:hypothetical protein
VQVGRGVSRGGGRGNGCMDGRKQWSRNGEWGVAPPTFVTEGPAPPTALLFSLNPLDHLLQPN